jgi:hypothetical protein
MRINASPKILISGILLAVLSGCLAFKERLECITESNHNLSYDNKNFTTSSAFEGLNINIGVDGSESMVGFVSKVGTSYNETIKAIEGVVASQGLAGQTRYWRLGIGKSSKKPLLLTATDFKKASRPDFYCRGTDPRFECVSSSLLQIYDLPDQLKLGSTARKDSEPSPSEDVNLRIGDDQKTRTTKREVPHQANSLTVMLTDLEPDAGSLNLLAQAFQNLLATDQAKTTPPTSVNGFHAVNKVSVLALRSYFDGTIYPAEQDAFTPFPYSNQGKDLAKYGRPFYLIISGPVSAVDTFSMKLRELNRGSANALQEVSFIRGSAKIVGLDAAMTGQYDDNWKNLRPIRSFQRRIPLESSEWFLAAVKPRPKAEASRPIQIRLYTRSSPTLIGAKVQPSDINVVSDTRNALSIKQVKQVSGRLVIEAEINPDMITKGSSTLQATLELNRNDLERSLWEEWNSNTGQPAGYKTQNLVTFLDTLNQASNKTQSNIPALKLCMGIDTHSGPSRQLVLFLGGIASIVAAVVAVVTVAANRADKNNDY